MKGIIIKTETGWNISYDEKLNISPDNSRVVAKKTIPLSKKEPYNLTFIKTLTGDEFKEVDFEIIEEYVEPEGIHCNRGDFIKVASILKPNSLDTWDDVIKIFLKPNISWQTKESIVRSMYECPIKKEN